MASNPLPGTLDPSFVPDILNDGQIVTIAALTNGQVYVAGTFTKINGVGRTNLARLNSDGSVDASFAPEAVVDTLRYVTYASPNSVQRSVTAQMLVLPDGGLLVSGWRIDTNRPGKAALFKFDRTGRLDTDFVPRFDTLQDTFQLSLTAIAMQADGKIVVAGSFEFVNGLARHRLARLNANGSTDTSFEPQLDAAMDDEAWLNSLALQSDGKVVVGGGWYATANRPMTPLLFRLSPDGSLETNFDLNYLFGQFNRPAIVQVVRVQTDQKIVVAGNFDWIGPVFRLNPDGSPDPNFSSGFLGNSILAMEVSTDGKNKLFVVGSWDVWPQTLLYRLNADGSDDSTFDSSLSAGSRITSIQSAPGGKVLVAGNPNVGGEPTMLALLNPDGTPAATPRAFAHLPGSVSSLNAAPADKSYITGQFNQIGAVRRSRLARLNADGTTDESFNSDLANALGLDSSSLWLWPLTVQPDGKLLLVAGNIYSTNLIIRLNLDGSLDTGWQPQTIRFYQDLSLHAVAQADGKIVCAGMYLHDAPYGNAIIFRLNADGTLDADYTPLQTSQINIAAFAVQADGKVLFSLGGGPSRLNADGSLDETFHAPSVAEDAVYDLLIDAHQRILVSHIGPAFSEGSLSRLNPDGSLDTSFESDLGGAFIAWPGTLTLQADGKILVGTAFWRSSPFVPTVTRLNADGSWDTGFETSAFNSSVTTILVQPDGAVLAQGNFTVVDNAPRYNLARLLGGESVPQLPGIVSAPTNSTLFAGATAEFEVVAKGLPQISYQWQRDGAALPGANRRILSLPNVGTNDAAQYTVVVSNALGSVTSVVAVLQVIPTVPLAQALNNAELTWFTVPQMNPTDSWVGLLDVSHDGQHSARNQPLPDNGTAILLTEFASPGVLSFWWKVSSETGYDFLQFRVGQTLLASISGETAWQQLSCAVTAGQRAEWRYEKDGSLSGGADCGWVDEVVFTPSPVQPFQLRVHAGLSDGKHPLTWTGEPGRAYTVQASSNLVDWVTLTHSICSMAEMQFLDVEASQQPQRFYRVVTP